MGLMNINLDGELVAWILLFASVTIAAIFILLYNPNRNEAR